MDSPGLFDTELPHKTIEDHIRKAVSDFDPGPHAFLFVHRLDDRFTEQDYNVYQCLKARFGKSFVEHTIMVFTHADVLQQERLTIEEYVKNTDTLKTLLIEISGRYHVVDNKMLGDRSQSSQLFTIVDSIGGSFYIDADAVKLREAQARAERARKEQEETERRRVEAETAAERQRLELKRELDRIRDKKRAEELRAIREQINRKREEAQAERDLAEEQRNTASNKNKLAGKKREEADNIRPSVTMLALGMAFIPYTLGVSSLLAASSIKKSREARCYLMSQAEELTDEASSLKQKASKHEDKADRLDKEADELERALPRSPVINTCKPS